MKRKLDKNTLQKPSQENLKPNSFNKFTDILPLISNFLMESEKNAVITAHKTLYDKFHHKNILTSLLGYVVTGNEYKVFQILKSRPELALIQGCIKDKSG